MISAAIGFNENQQKSIVDLLKNHQTNPDKSKRKEENERIIKEAIELGKLSKSQERFNIAMLNASDDQNDIDNFLAHEVSDSILTEKGFYPQDFCDIRKFMNSSLNMIPSQMVQIDSSGMNLKGHLLKKRS
ncbi:hypothetical protein TVAG_110510 [Trichomonas vaginalis G3]|uniref:Uncharacterized protein n=1 Tax=Trichomonas vaginalis (strain ATCC PRA-98 / G3) TaxID=412133 RepID=A2DGQ2_TRIV3|nr:hypothetical protein TVAGG3_0997540 [Trichomonas vaginalis G3]EAY20439.1 hypothetical protein TVAG_110510 [Trichomonas vaginalis G3]KAI5490511.1 hypothetical protein TVAGG3_0997540 [Trichomonas vaginalis G3]|eukprot:XP_001581425.1 hypothetical protein [Trichomonas vaginalis G3]